MTEGFLFADDADAPLLRLSLANRFVERLRGLLGHAMLDDDRGLWIAPCGSVHTFGMRFPIDVVFVDRDGRIVRVAEHVAAGRMAFARKAASVVEVAAGGIARIGLRAGQRLSWSDSARGDRLPLSTARPGAASR